MPQEGVSISLKNLFMKLELFHCATNIPLRLYGTNNGLLSSYIPASQEMPDFLDFRNYEKAFLNIGQGTLYYTSDISEHYLSFCFEYNNTAYKIAAGPTVDNTFDKKYLLKISADKNLKLSDYGNLEAYFRNLTRYSSISLRRAEPLLRYLLCGSELDLPGIIKRESNSVVLERKNIQVNETQRYHHSINKDTLIMEAVKTGDREKLYSLLYTPGDGPEGILCKNDPVRSYKNLFIVSVSYTTKAAMEGGVDSESAYTLSDTFIQMVEEIHSYEEITELLIEMLNSFMDLVEKANKIKYTSPVYKTIDYINKHYYSNISVKELSEKVHLSESHLLRLFREQTNMSLKSFIIDKRIREVKNLLKYTDHSIAVICEMTGFNDQSYMTNQFRKLTKTTPKKYRGLVTSQQL